MVNFYLDSKINGIHSGTKKVWILKLTNYCNSVKYANQPLGQKFCEKYYGSQCYLLEYQGFTLKHVVLLENMRVLVDALITEEECFLKKPQPTNQPTNQIIWHTVYEDWLIWFFSFFYFPMLH